MADDEAMVEAMRVFADAYDAFTDNGGSIVSNRAVQAAAAVIQSHTVDAVGEAVERERERCAALCEELAEAGDAYERKCAGDRSWFNLQGEGQRMAATAIRQVGG